MYLELLLSLDTNQDRRSTPADDNLVREVDRFENKSKSAFLYKNGSVQYLLNERKKESQRTSSLTTLLTRSVKLMFLPFDESQRYFTSFATISVSVSDSKW
jgi:hypothetical protein